jgi:hypothetical protein
VFYGAAAGDRAMSSAPPTESRRGLRGLGPGIRGAGDSRVTVDQGPPLLERRKKVPLERLVHQAVDDPFDLVALEDETTSSAERNTV